MRDQVLELAERGKELTPEDRSRLVDMLLVSLHGAPSAEIEAAWDQEAERRLDAYDRGEMQAMGVSEFLCARLLVELAVG